MCKIRGPVLLLLVLAIGLGSTGLMPAVHASFCDMQVAGVDFPQTAALNQTVQTTTRLMITCVTSMVDIAGRVDLIDQTTNKTLSISGFRIGYISQPQETKNVTVSNLASAPSEAGPWTLSLNVLLFAAGNLVAAANQPLQIQVGAAIPTVTAQGTQPWLVGLIVAVVAIIAVAGLLLYRNTRKGKRHTKSKK